MAEEKSSLDTGAVSEARIKELEKELSSQARESKWVRWIMVSIFIVVVVAFIGMSFTVYGIIQQYLGTQSSSYQSLIDKITTQNVKIESMYQQCYGQGEPSGEINNPINK
jgi:hypothetical protein